MLARFFFILIALLAGIGELAAQGVAPASEPDLSWEVRDLKRGVAIEQERTQERHKDSILRLADPTEAIIVLGLAVARASDSFAHRRDEPFGVLAWNKANVSVEHLFGGSMLNALRARVFEQGPESFTGLFERGKPVAKFVARPWRERLLPLRPILEKPLEQKILQLYEKWERHGYEGEKYKSPCRFYIPGDEESENCREIAVELHVHLGIPYGDSVDMRLTADYFYVLGILYRRHMRGGPEMSEAVRKAALEVLEALK